MRFENLKKDELAVLLLALFEYQDTRKFTLSDSGKEIAKRLEDEATKAYQKLMK